MLELTRSFFRFPDSFCNTEKELPVRLGSSVQLPKFDALTSPHNLSATMCEQMARALQLEQYPQAQRKSVYQTGITRKLYYFLRPLLGVRIRRLFQRAALAHPNSEGFPEWPVDFSADAIFEAILLSAMQAEEISTLPFIWFWPDGHKSCAMMTHDVETSRGLEFCARLMEIDDSFGIKSSFQLIPEGRYLVTDSAIAQFQHKGFEVNVHDLNHDGRLFEDRQRFSARKHQIRQHAQRWHASGFRAGALYRNQAWMPELNFAYDMSVPNVARYDPQPGGCCTVFPYFNHETLEIPVTTIQDYTLFNILNDYSISIWQQQFRAICQRHGLASVIAHPDYLQTSQSSEVYRSLLDFMARLRANDQMWIALPGAVNTWWRQRARMYLAPEGSGWKVVGEGSERAQVAFADTTSGSLKFVLP